jgi:ABC-type Fe3+ transport system substrate-binding protein
MAVSLSSQRRRFVRRRIDLRTIREPFHAARRDIEGGNGQEGRLYVSLYWPNEQGRAVVPFFTKDFPFVKDVTYERSSGVDNSRRMFMEVRQGRAPKFDVLGVVTETLDDYAKEGLFVRPPFDYRTVLKFFPADWPQPDPRAIDSNGIHVATAALVRGIAYNKNLVPPNKIPKEWMTV